jgi:phosphate starvation-inducible protein PhoH and related proteins
VSSESHSQIQCSKPTQTPDGIKIILQFPSSDLVMAFAGSLDRHLKILSRNLHISVQQRGDKIFLVGQEKSVMEAQDVVLQIANLFTKGERLKSAEIDQMSRLLKEDPNTKLQDLVKETIFVTKKKRIYPRSPRQLSYFKAIQKNDLVFGVGPAGTGKSYLAMAMALSALTKEQVQKIILCRPAVEAGEKLGFLPGDMMEKVNPYLRPLYDALFDLIGAEKSQRLIEREIIEVAPLAFMRGRTLADAFVILDEAQNTTAEQMKMFLTRIGMGSKVVVNGDPSQVDLPFKQESGLRQALRILHSTDGISIIELTDADVVRHPLVGSIIRAYDRYHSQNRRR